VAQAWEHSIVSFKRYFVGFVGGILLMNAFAFFAFGRFNVGVLVPFFIGSSFVSWAIYKQRWQTWLDARPIRLKLWHIFYAGFIFWLCSLIVFFYQLQSKIEDNSALNSAVHSQKVKAIVVLGSGTPNCQASMALIERLKKGYEMGVKYPSAWLVVSGGVDFGHTCSEAEVMAKYLLDQKFDANRLLQEPESTSTRENLLFSAKILKQKGLDLDDSIQIVTSDFHTIRAEKIARRAGYSNPQLVPAMTPLYMRYNSWVREYFAFFSGWVLNEY
jgi:uncharacterized SAM-binding protein YcdF (DUF218 family)